ncbi:MAG: Invasion associated locus B family protein [Pseudolabrys sp.]|nr:Invasion associated locus B family protein [Pseudolabrys sp.]
MKIFRISVALFAAATWVGAAAAQDAKPAPKPATPAPEAKPAPKPAAAPKPATPAAAAPAGAEQPLLLGQYGDWGAYKATPGGKIVCFALAKPANAVTEPAGRKRDQSYLFISSRPAEKVKHEISTIVGYPQRTGGDTAATVGTASYTMYAQSDAAWLKNPAEEAQMIDAMRKGQDIVIKSTSSRGTKSTDSYSLKGLAQALDKVEQECK